MVDVSSSLSTLGGGEGGGGPAWFIDSDGGTTLPFASVPFCCVNPLGTGTTSSSTFTTCISWLSKRNGFAFEVASSESPLFPLIPPAPIVCTDGVDAREINEICEGVLFADRAVWNEAAELETSEVRRESMSEMRETGPATAMYTVQCNWLVAEGEADRKLMRPGFMQSSKSKMNWTSDGGGGWERKR